RRPPRIGFGLSFVGAANELRADHPRQPGTNSRPRLLLACVCASLVLGGFVFQGTAAAQRNNPLIRQGQELYDELRYEEALQVLSAALVRSGNSETERATTYRLLAFTYLALGRPEEAEGAYRSLLALEPGFEVPADLSPRFREFFTQAAQRWEADGRPGVSTAPPAAVTIAHTSPAQADPEQEVPLSATLDDADGRVARVVVAYRQGTSDVFRRLDCERQPDGSYTATIPGEDVAPPLVEYYFEALDGAGLPVAARGDVAAPLRIAVEGGGSVVTKWWFWTIIGVVAAGAVVTTAVVLTRDDPAPPPTQGTLIVNIR
ncbi:MAG: tetratricopeptide repeat protein, partial [Myxococcales bacterium]|nr:tetratricopeptide repeat protein [Myxococcales bacterium]